MVSVVQRGERQTVTALAADQLYGCFTDPYESFTDGLGALQIGISLTRDP